MAGTVEKPAILVDDLIRWYDHHHFRGYVFAAMRRGRRHVKYFSAKEVGVRRALARARAHRDAMLKRLEPPTRLKSKNSRNTTGVIGVTLAKERTRGGNTFWRYVATWPVRNSVRGAKASFSVTKYGKREAWRRASVARKHGVAAFKASVSHLDYQELGRRKRKTRR